MKTLRKTADGEFVGHFVLTPDPDPETPKLHVSFGAEWRADLLAKSEVQPLFQKHIPNGDCEELAERMLEEGFIAFHVYVLDQITQKHINIYDCGCSISDPSKGTA